MFDLNEELAKVIIYFVIQEGKKFVEKEGGVNQDAKTRGQEKEIEAKEEKEATKRAADDKTVSTYVCCVITSKIVVE